MARHDAVQAGGPAVKGTWTHAAVVLGNFRGGLGIHGSRDSVTIVLLEETSGERAPLRTWTNERGEVIHRAT
jgi:hypothetical protein